MSIRQKKYVNTSGFYCDEWNDEILPKTHDSPYNNKNDPNKKYTTIITKECKSPATFEAEPIIGLFHYTHKTRKGSVWRSIEDEEHDKGKLEFQELMPSPNKK
jgi:hypothetical protein